MSVKGNGSKNVRVQSKKESRLYLSASKTLKDKVDKTVEGVKGTGKKAVDTVPNF